MDDLLQFKSVREKDLYLTDFKRIASKGIITFDKTIVEDFNDPFYHVVAWPNLEKDYYDLKSVPPIVIPEYISNKRSQNISENVINSRLEGKEYDKFQLFDKV